MHFFGAVAVVVHLVLHLVTTTSPEDTTTMTLDTPSMETGRRVAAFAPTDGAINPEELGDYFEGDILRPRMRNGLIAEGSRWPDGVIPYEMRGTFNQREMRMLTDAMAGYTYYTCLRFRPRTAADVDYVALENTPTGCWSNVGRVGGKQVVNLQTPGCFAQIGTPLHELMHAAGFMHEQNRFERDDSVDIVWANIQAGRDENFRKLNAATVSGYGVPYDFSSVMHYSTRAFSRNGQATIVAKGNPDVVMGQRAGFSKGDVRKLRKMYACADADAPITTPAPPTQTPPPTPSSGGEVNHHANLLEMLFG